MSLAVAAILAYGLAALVNRLLRANGGFFLHSLGYQLAPVHTWPKHAWVTGEGLLALFGAKPQGPAAALAFALLHLAGVARGRLGPGRGGPAVLQLARPDQPGPAGRDRPQRGWCMCRARWPTRPT